MTDEKEIMVAHGQVFTVGKKPYMIIQQSPTLPKDRHFILLDMKDPIFYVPKYQIQPCDVDYTDEDVEFYLFDADEIMNAWFSNAPVSLLEVPQS